MLLTHAAVVAVLLLQPPLLCCCLPRLICIGTVGMVVVVPAEARLTSQALVGTCKVLATQVKPAMKAWPKVWTIMVICNTIYHNTHKMRASITWSLASQILVAGAQVGNDAVTAGDLLHVLVRRG